MLSLLTVSKARQKIAEYLRKIRLSKGLTQSGLADRSGVSLPTLRKFEQQGLISLESLLKLSMALGCLEGLVKAFEPSPQEFSSIDEVLTDRKKKEPKRGWLS
jgi:transcriptional regulator with XRE-family HTH domain